MIKPLTPSAQLPLQGRRILVTAPRNYAIRLAQQIAGLGGLPLLMPTIETCLLEDYTELDAALQWIEEFHWIAFTSRNGIDAFFQRLNALELSPSILQHCRICAIGQDAARLPAFGRRTDLFPNEASPVGIVNELAKIPQIDQQQILVPIPKVVGIPEPDIVPNFILGLRQLGMTVCPVPAYITRPLDRSLYEVELDLLRRGKMDAIAFSSTGEIEAFLTLIDGSKDYLTCPIACFGPYTATNAEKLGFTVAVVAENFHSFTGFAEAIATFFTSQSVDKTRSP